MAHLKKKENKHKKVAGFGPLKKLFSFFVFSKYLEGVCSLLEILGRENFFDRFPSYLLLPDLLFCFL